MPQRIAALLLALAVLPTATADAQTPAIDFRGVQDSLAGGPTQVLVLGTPHLSALGDRFEPAHLGPLLDRLAAYAPDVITIEAVPGQTCDLLVRYADAYPGVADDYCADPTPAREATGLAGPEAEAEVRVTLASWPAEPAPAQRRRLAAAFLAAGDPWSALVQWLRLPEPERIASDGLDAALVDRLRRLAASVNENGQIGAQLAARLGHERVYPADDHTADAVIAHHGGDFWAAMREVWAQDIDRYEATKDSVIAGLGSAEGLLAFYQFWNRPEAQDLALDNDLRLALRESGPERYGRQYVTWWQVRNLRMVAHIVAAAAAVPGARVLSVVGSSHKPYFDAYLDLMHDIDLVDTGSVLGEVGLTPAR